MIAVTRKHWRVSLRGRGGEIGVDPCRRIFRKTEATSSSERSMLLRNIFSVAASYVLQRGELDSSVAVANSFRATQGLFVLLVLLPGLLCVLGRKILDQRAFSASARVGMRDALLGLYAASEAL